MRHRGPFNMSLRYAAVVLAGLAMGGLCFALITRRAELEPIVRLLHPLMLGRRGHRYEAGDYALYEVFAGIIAAVPFLMLGYAWATNSRTNRQIDTYLAGRLPKHERIISGDRTCDSEQTDQTGFGRDLDDRS